MGFKFKYLFFLTFYFYFSDSNKEETGVMEQENHSKTITLKQQADDNDKFSFFRNTFKLIKKSNFRVTKKKTLTEIKEEGKEQEEIHENLEKAKAEPTLLMRAGTTLQVLYAFTSVNYHF